jgi:hypothetical protein
MLALRLVCLLIGLLAILLGILDGTIARQPGGASGDKDGGGDAVVANQGKFESVCSSWTRSGSGSSSFDYTGSTGLRALLKKLDNVSLGGEVVKNCTTVLGWCVPRPGRVCVLELESLVLSFDNTPGFVFLLKRVNVSCGDEERYCCAACSLCGVCQPWHARYSSPADVEMARVRASGCTLLPCAVCC